MSDFRLMSDAQVAKLPGNQPQDFDTFTTEEQDRLLAWIRTELTPAKRVFSRTSYGLKHDFERDTRIYVSNGAFKGAMALCGYEAVDTSLVNWQYRVKFTKRRRELGY